MTPALAASIPLGIVLGLGLWSLLALVPRIGAPRLADRIAPYLVDVSPAARDRASRRPAEPASLIAGLLAPAGVRAQRTLAGLLGGDETVAKRLRQAGSTMTVERFRSRQLLWAAGGAVIGALLATLASRVSARGRARARRGGRGGRRPRSPRAGTTAESRGPRPARSYLGRAADGGRVLDAGAFGGGGHPGCPEARRPHRQRRAGPRARSGGRRGQRGATAAGCAAAVLRHDRPARSDPHDRPAARRAGARHPARRGAARAGAGFPRRRQTAAARGGRQEGGRDARAVGFHDFARHDRLRDLPRDPGAAAGF